ncbi:MAG: BON domain-containing protein [Patescibacteria group bacterium]
MKSDTQLHRDVVDELNWDPMVSGLELGVAAKGGVVTLTGTVDSYPKRLAAIKAVERVIGVTAVADDMTVKIGRAGMRSDADIAHAAVNALQWDTEVPDDLVKLSVDDGWVTLEGSVDWYHEMNAAEGAVRYLTGVRGVTNNIRVKSPASTLAVQSKIEAAFKRSAEFDARAISVQTADGRVTLTGKVRSWAERRDAERAAWNAPGVREVDDRLMVTA